MKTRSLLCLMLILATASPSTATPPGWPASISGDSGFADLGRAIKNEPGFPANGTEIDKARYVFSRMQNVAQSYGLKSGSGGLVSNIAIGLYRLRNDPEGAQCLKGRVGWGNCGEWSYAMSEIFGGAGVNNRVAYGDKSGGTGSSLRFSGTDTMVIVEERSPDGKVSRRVFDPFRAAYHSDTSQPTPTSLQEWGDMPLTDYDKWKDETRQSWQNSIVPLKPFIKEASTQSELVLPFQARIDPKTTNRPKTTPAKPGCVAAGSWSQTLERMGRSVWKIDKDGKATESGLGNSTGTASLAGNTLRIDWTNPNEWAGSYVWTLDAGCKSGSGTQTFTAGPLAGSSRTSTVNRQ